MPIKKTLSAILATSLLALTADGAGNGVADLKIEISSKKFVLKNGLTLIVHEDHKTPVVAVHLWYHVGSRDEKPGKTGFAHLFEHLMFTGSEHLKGQGDQRAFYEAMEQVGGRNANGTTNPDRTSFYETVPTNALDQVLWIESDRMGHLLSTIDQARLDLQRGVVQNEKRQNQNQPYGRVWDLIFKGTAPTGHPYSWITIGSMEDLNAASLEDVHNWFKAYYGAANVVLVLAGDIDANAALKKVEHYFGDIPGGPPIERLEKWVPQMRGTRRETMQDRVPQARIYKVWNIPTFGEPDSVYLDLVASVLTSGKSSRLYKRLVHDEQLATDVGAWSWPQEISGIFLIQVTARPGGDLSRIDRVIDEELARFRSKGPTAKELERSRAQNLASFVRGSERVGGFGGKADILAESETYRGRPDFFQTILKFQREATVGDLQNAARRWLTDDVYILEVHPFPNYETTEASADRSQLPTPGAMADVAFPAFQRATLSNGLKIILVERHATPLVNMQLLVDAGSADDPAASSGAARLTLEMLEQGTTHRTGQEISDDFAALGARYAAEVGLDSSDVGLSALPSTLDAALAVLADVILNPSFPEAEFQRLQKEAIARIQREKVDPVSMALRVYPRLLYGAGHEYANPLTGSGTESSVASLKAADLRRFHDKWFKPNNATLVVVGDTSLKELTPRLEKLFGQWESAAVPMKLVPSVQPQPKTTIYLVDRPGSIQSLIFAGHIAPPRLDPDDAAISTMITVLGGSFTSRLNMNLREEKHWSYGSSTWLQWTRGQRPLIIYASVQADKTRESLVEINREVRDLLGPKPIAAPELSKAQKNMTLSLPGSWETDDTIIDHIAEIINFGFPEDYFTTYPGKIRALSTADVNAAARKVLHPDQFVWVVVGDRAKVEPGLRDLGWSDIHLLDADGNAVK